MRVHLIFKKALRIVCSLAVRVGHAIKWYLSTVLKNTQKKLLEMDFIAWAKIVVEAIVFILLVRGTALEWVEVILAFLS